MRNLYIQQTKNNTNNTAWVFPGQSSQKLGMESELLVYPFAQTRFQQAEQILGWSVAEVCQHQDKLSRTLYIQPCLYVVETLLAELMKRKGYRPKVLAGYSLGEYAAIYAAGGFDFETGLQLIKHRAEIMNRAPKGRMVALIGFEPEQLGQQILHAPNVWRVNDDLTVAIVSGIPKAVESLVAKVKAKRAIPLNVDSAFHTPLMVGAAAEFEQILESISFNSLEVPVLSSTELVPTVEIARLKKSLIRQMFQPIKWRAISLSIAAQGIKKVVEIGPGKDLTKQMKRICPGLDFTATVHSSPVKANAKTTYLPKRKIAA